MLTAPGEYHVSAANLTLSFIPPKGAKPGGSYSLSRLGSVVTATGVSGVSFENLEIRHSRGAGASAGPGRAQRRGVCSSRRLTCRGARRPRPSAPPRWTTE